MLLDGRYSYPAPQRGLHNIEKQHNFEDHYRRELRFVRGPPPPELYPQAAPYDDAPPMPPPPYNGPFINNPDTIMPDYDPNASYRPANNDRQQQSPPIPPPQTYYVPPAPRQQPQSIHQGYYPLNQETPIPQLTHQDQPYFVKQNHQQQQQQLTFQTFPPQQDQQQQMQQSHQQQIASNTFPRQPPQMQHKQQQQPPLDNASSSTSVSLLNTVQEITTTHVPNNNNQFKQSSSEIPYQPLKLSSSTSSIPSDPSLLSQQTSKNYSNPSPFTQQPNNIVNKNPISNNDIPQQPQQQRHQPTIGIFNQSIGKNDIIPSYDVRNSYRQHLPHLCENSIIPHSDIDNDRHSHHHSASAASRKKNIASGQGREREGRRQSPGRSSKKSNPLASIPLNIPRELNLRDSTSYAPLGCEEDKHWLSELQCYVRSHLVEVFGASDKDIAAPVSVFEN